MIPDTPEQLHLKEASELQSNVSGSDSGVQHTHHNTLLQLLNMQTYNIHLRVVFIYEL